MEARASGSAGATQPAQPAPPNTVPRPSLTVPQLLAFGAFGPFALLALLPSDAGIRFERALYYRAGSTPQPGIAQLKKV